jgi:hypothetical protein
MTRKGSQVQVLYGPPDLYSEHVRNTRLAASTDSTRVRVCAATRPRVWLRITIPEMRRWIVGVILTGALTLAACSSHSLASDRSAVNALQATVARDHAALNDFSSLSTSQVVACAVASQAQSAPGVAATTSSSLPSYCPGSAAYSRLQAKFSADEIKLQVAEDQLKKDESGG